MMEQRGDFVDSFATRRVYRTKERFGQTYERQQHDGDEVPGRTSHDLDT